MSRIGIELRLFLCRPLWDACRGMEIAVNNGQEKTGYVRREDTGRK